MTAAPSLAPVTEHLGLGGVAVLAPVGDEGVGNLMAAASCASAGAINLMLHEARGVLRVVLPPDRCATLRLERQPPRRLAPGRLGEAMLMLVDAAHGVTTGVSVPDRLRTISVLADPAATPADLSRPGHVLPIAARSGRRRGASEAALELVQALGLGQAAVVCHALRADGAPMTPEDLRRLADRIGLPFIDRPAQPQSSPTVATGLPARVDLDEFRHVLGHFPTGVAVITSAGSRGPEGMACNSFTSVSLDPPLVMFCPAKSSTTWARMRPSGRFAVNVLGEGDASLSRGFAARGSDRFHGVAHRPSRLGSPLLDRALAWVDCTLEAEHDAGDHWVVVGRVRGLGARGGRPLVFFRGRYGECVDAPAADREAA